jgi:hypothetical protein
MLSELHKSRKNHTLAHIFVVGLKCFGFGPIFSMETTRPSYHPDILTLELQALNRLPPGESAEVDDHLFRCDHCLELASGVHQETRTLLRDLVVDAYLMQQNRTLLHTETISPLSSISHYRAA